MQLFGKENNWEMEVVTFMINRLSLKINIQVTSPQTDLSVLILSLMSSSLLYINRDKWSLKLRLSSDKTSFIIRNAKLKLMAYCFFFLLTFG